MDRFVADGNELIMCGITGFWQKNTASLHENVESLLKGMNDTLRHRGPDGEGVWVCQKSGIGLGHRRLSIRDLSSAGSQPMISMNGRFVIVFNGEIYNAEELRQKLISEGLKGTWRGSSDTEVLLEAISCWGVDAALRRLIGMFAFALWDSVAQELMLARDRFGEKPLFYATAQETVIFGSELKALQRHSVMPREIDTQSLGLYLRYGYVPAPHCIFQGVAKLLPGDLRVFRRVEGRIVENSRPYWRHEIDLYGEGCCHSEYSSVSVAADAFQPIFEEAVRRQLVADVPLGAFLSGGIDSSLIVAMMQRQGSGRTKTFTIGFDDQSYDEAPFAREVARHLGTEHTEQYVTQREIFNILPSLPQVYDEPLGDSSQIPTMLVSQIARKEVTVALSGDGGDELFAGYNHYRWGPRVIRGRACIPASFEPVIGSLIAWGGHHLSKQRLIRLAEVVRARPQTDTLRLLTAALPDVKKVLANELAYQEDWTLPALPGHLLAAERLLAFDLHGFLPDDILVKVDRAAMSVGLETRAPFLDHMVASFAWSLPLHLRTGSTSGKLILKELLSRFLPCSLFERPKSGFGLPLDRWLREDLKPMAEKYLLQVALRYDYWLNPKEIASLWHEHQSGKVNRQRELWVLLMLLMWLDSSF